MIETRSGGRAQCDDRRAPRILMVTDRAPGHDTGYGIRVGNVIEGLRSVGALHVCLIDSSTDGVPPPDLGDVATSRLRIHNPPSWAKGVRIRRLLPANVRYDGTAAARRALGTELGREPWNLVWCSRARVHLLTQGVLGGPRVVDLDDLSDAMLRTEMRDRRAVRGPLVTLPRTLRDALDVRLWTRLQRHIAAQVERVLVCSVEDCAQLGVDNCAVVPNGYPAPAGPPKPADHTAAGRRPRILFVGPLTYEPNRLAVEWFGREVLPTIQGKMPDVEMVVVGDDEGVTPRRPADAHVTYAGLVPDVTPYYDAATIAVTPLHSGGGTRIKVIEALARQVPLVSTSFGCAGHDLQPGRELLVADDAEDFAAACLALLADGGRRARIAAAGLAAYRKRLTAAATSGPVADLAGSIIAGRTSQHGLVR